MKNLVLIVIFIFAQASFQTILKAQTLSTKRPSNEFETPEDHARRVEKEQAILDQQKIDLENEKIRNQKALEEGTSIYGEDQPLDTSTLVPPWEEFNIQLKSQPKQRPQINGEPDLNWGWPSDKDLQIGKPNVSNQSNNNSNGPIDDNPNISSHEKNSKDLASRDNTRPTLNDTEGYILTGDDPILFSDKNSKDLQTRGCEPGFEKRLRPVNVLFLIDVSGSNYKTDPRKKFRSETIRYYVESQKNRSDIKSNIIFFNSDSFNRAGFSDSHIPEIKIPGKPIKSVGFFKIPVISFMLSNFIVEMDDIGETNYESPLKRAKKIIEADLIKSSPDTIYQVFLLTDGLPNVSSEIDLKKLYSENKIDEVVNYHTSLVYPLQKLNNGYSVQLNTIHYGFRSDFIIPTKILTTMAVAGKGFSTHTTGQQIFDIKQHVSLTHYSCVRKKTETLQ